MEHRAGNLAPLLHPFFAHHEHIRGDAKRIERLAKPDRFVDAVRDLTFDDEKVQVAVRVRLTTGLRAEQDDPRPWGRGLGEQAGPGPGGYSPIAFAMMLRWISEVPP
jgi:hypothetical protein